jgi:hypothetical protein
MKKLLHPAIIAYFIFASGAVFAQQSLLPATPFGVEMGMPGSCAALPKALKALDPNVQKAPVGPGVPDSPDISFYQPMNIVFPGALNNLLSMCTEGRLQMVKWSVSRGPANAILIDVFGGLADKYGNRYTLKEIANILEKGGQLFFYARSVLITLEFSKESSHFMMTYEYTGVLAKDEIDQRLKSNEERIKRKISL